MLTDRDRRIIALLENFNCATTRQIKELYFKNVTLRECQRRLRTLTDNKYISRDRIGVNSDYLYYFKRPQQLEHDNTRLNFYINATKQLDLYDFDTEYRIDKVRSDAFFTFAHDGKLYGAFLEVQLLGRFDQQKYEKLYASGVWREQWAAFPLVVVVSPRPRLIEPTKLKYIVMDTRCDMNDLKIELGVRHCTTTYDSRRDIYDCKR